MIVWPGLRRSMGTRSGIPIANRAAHFDAALGITSSGGFASAWADQSGNGRSLLQATGANQPIHLAYSGTKYGWLPAVASNYFSTPSATANRITGSIDIDTEVLFSDYTPGASYMLVSKSNGAAQTSYALYMNGIGNLLFFYSNDGSTARTATSSAANTLVDGVRGYLRATYDSSTGKVNFSQSTDGSNWSAIGIEQTITSGAIFAGSSPVEVGSYAAGLIPAAGRFYRARIYNGIRESGGTLAVDFDPSRWTSGTTFTASTGETWTINSTGSKPAQIVDRPSLLFDGAAHYMKTAAFTLSQPETVYLVAKQVSWANGDAIFDGVNLVQMLLEQETTTPNIAAFAGSAFTALNADLAVGARGVVSAVFNGASSTVQVNNGTAVTGSIGTGNAGGITLGARSNGVNPSNIQAYEALIYNVAHDAATRANVIRALMSKWGVA